MRHFDHRNPAYRNYVLAMLVVVYAVNFIDRQLLVILQEAIKRELSLSDTQLGLLTGPAFALFYATCGIPVAHWSESRARRDVISIALALWSLMTAACGLVQNFAQLLIARVGVGVGESGSSPPSHSMISDMFPPERRSTALSVFSIGGSMGILAGFMLGGWINQFLGWRSAFLVLGLPGLALALLVRFTVSEPPRGMSEDASAAPVARSMASSFTLLMRNPVFVFVALAAGFQGFALFGVGNWLPPYLMRVHGLSTGEAGTWLGLISGVVGGLGALAGGCLTDRLGRRDRRWYLWVPWLGLLIAAPLAAAAFFAERSSVALLFLVPVLFLHYMYLGPLLAVSHSLVDAHMRAFTSAVLFLSLNLIGFGLGPLCTGVISDVLRESKGVDGLRYAMLVSLLIGTAGASMMYSRAARHLRNESERCAQ
jgi:predicted MFS family arabinose efflux permease